MLRTAPSAFITVALYSFTPRLTRNVIRANFSSNTYHSLPQRRSLFSLPLGHIVGVVHLDDCVRNAKSRWAEPGKWHWILSKPRPIGPVKCKGWLGLWTPSRVVMRKLRQRQEPHVGIFWLFQGKVIIDSTPRTKAEPYGECRTHARGHLEQWTELQRIGTVPAGVEYEEPPRGRVVWYPAREHFLLYADRCILRKPAALKKVMDALFLPRDRTTTSSDPHYRCPRCLSGYGRAV
jgi:hypothetical protein